MATVQEVFQMMKRRIESNPDKVSGLTAAYQFELTGDGGGTFHAVLDLGASDIGEGAAANPGCTVTMAATDFLAMAGGQLNPTAAFMSGRLKLKGDMGLAMRLQSLIS